jgi:hypothetical protein
VSGCSVAASWRVSTLRDATVSRAVSRADANARGNASNDFPITVSLSDGLACANGWAVAGTANPSRRPTHDLATRRRTALTVFPALLHAIDSAGRAIGPWSRLSGITQLVWSFVSGLSDKWILNQTAVATSGSQLIPERIRQAALAGRFETASQLCFETCGLGENGRSCFVNVTGSSLVEQSCRFGSSIS